MMNEIIKRLEDKGYMVEKRVVNKNGIEKEGLVVKKEGCNTAPIFYPNDTSNIDDFIRYVEDTMNDDIEFDVNFIMDLQKCKNKIFPIILGKKLSEDKVTRRFLDLNVYYKIKVDAYNDMCGSITVTEQILNNWNITEDELYNISVNNIKNTFEIMNLFSLLSGMLGDDLKETKNPPMYVVINKDKLYASSCLLILDDIVKDSILSEYDKLNIIPSSIHEIIIIPKMEHQTNNEINNIINDINSTQLEDEEILSNHLYKYDKINGLTL